MDNRHDMLQLLRQVAEGTIPPEEALLQLKQEPFQDLGYAKVDLHRGIRQGAAEVIYGAGKTPEQIAGIAAAMGARGCKNVLITRLSPEAAEQVGQSVPLAYRPLPRLAVAFPGERRELGSIVVATGGTSDMPVAEEAALTAEVLGNRVTRLYDVGVAGLHRLLANLAPLMDARCVVAAAGMEGALASVIGGLGSLPGAIIGAFLLGVVETGLLSVLGSGYSTIATFAIMLVFLLLRPQGIAGSNVQEKA